MKKLKILLQFRYRYIYLAFGLVCLILNLQSLWYLPVLIGYLFYIMKRHKDLIIPLCLLGGIVLLSQQVVQLKTPDQFKKLTITNIEENYLVGSSYSSTVILYTKSSQEFKVGDVIEPYCVFEEIERNTIPHTFSYRQYLLSKNITKTCNLKEFRYIKSSFHINIISVHVEEYIEEKIPFSSRYIKTFILADNDDIDEDIQDGINQLGISHLFAVSGLHVGLLVLMLNTIYKKVTSKDNAYIIIIPVLVIYMVITSFTPSIVRASMMFILLFINKKWNLSFSILDIISFIFIVMIICRPYYYYHIGFVLSFLMTYTIVLSYHLLQPYKIINQLHIITLIASIITLPIIVNLNKEVNMITLLINSFMVLYLSYIMLPLGYLTFLFPYVDFIYRYIIKLFELIVTQFQGITILYQSFTFVHPFQIIIYYILIFMLLSNTLKQYRNYVVSTIILFLIVSINIEKFNPTQSISMIDIYGDSILIRDRFDACNILIDTGITDDYDRVIEYVKGKNVTRIDLLIITHEDTDHNGERKDIYDNFNVVKELNKDNKTNIIQCGKLELNFYNTNKEYNKSNNQSLIFDIIIGSKRYLFTGDMEVEKEKDFMKYYNVDVDVLKSPHHGSITSSSEQFLDHISPERVLISCYRKNTHGHPHKEVIQRYEERHTEIYRTDHFGTIEFYYIFDLELTKTHYP